MDSFEGSDSRPNLITPVGYSVSSCGYCSSAAEPKSRKTSKSYGIWGHRVKADAYSLLIEHGWRRSGNYIYRPDCGYEGTCCAQMAIRLDVEDFRPTRQHKRSIAAADRALRSTIDEFQSPSASSSLCTPILQRSARARGKFTRKWDLEREMRALETETADNLLERALGTDNDKDRRRYMGQYHSRRSRQAEACRQGEGDPLRPVLAPRRRNLRTTLHIAACTGEKYALFRKYQAEVHQQSEEEISKRSGFERFLCLAPFPTVSTSETDAGEINLDSERPVEYGLYHMEWRLDGVLIALGVLDILPRYVSSVYLIYDPAFAHLQLGRISALREIALVKQLRRKAGHEAMQFYTMGLYVHDCAKMLYKAQYGPAQLLDPATSEWFPIAKILTLLDGGQRYNFSHDERMSVARKQTTTCTESRDSGDDTATSSEEGEDMDNRELPRPLPPGIADPSQLTASSLSRCLALSNGEVDLLQRILPRFSRAERMKALDCVASLGPLKSYFVLAL